MKQSALLSVTSLSKRNERGHPMSQATPRYPERDTAREGGTTASKDFKDMAERTADQVSSAARAVADQGREVTENFQAVADNFQKALSKSIREQPMTTVAAAVILGFMLGAIWKS